MEIILRGSAISGSSHSCGKYHFAVRTMNTAPESADNPSKKKIIIKK